MSSQPLSLLFILLGQGPQLQTWGPLESVEPLEPAGAQGEHGRKVGNCRSIGAPGLWSPGVDDATLEVTVTADLMSTPG